MLRVIMIEKFLRMNLPMSRVTTDCVANAIRGELVPKVVSCLQTVGNTISLTSVSRGVFLAGQWNDRNLYAESQYD